MVVDFIMRRAMIQHEFRIPWREPEWLTDLDFSDIALIRATKMDTQEMMPSLNRRWLRSDSAK